MYKFENFYQALCEVANNHPKAVAIFCDKNKITYQDLLKKVQNVAAFLQSFGIVRGDKVAMVVKNCEEFIYSYLAITTIGAVAVPMNTFLKKEEFEYLFNDCEAKLAIVSESNLNEVKGLEKTTKVKHFIVVGSQGNSSSLYINFDQLLHHGNVLKLDYTPNLDDICSIIYTSGTTGHPKGAILSYKNLISNVSAAADIFNIKPTKDRFMVYLPMFHTFTLTTMVLLPLYTASSIILVKSVFPFSNVLKQTLLKRATVFLGVPAIYTALVKAKIPWYFKFFNKIRCFICGSAPLAQQTIDEFYQIFPRAKLIEGYGLSECSPVVSANRLDKQKVGSVGLPIQGCEVKIVNNEMMEVPVGVVGEIIIKGDNVMQGYLNRSDATDETIVNGWLKSGDLGKVDEDGFIYIVDRIKDLIISKGQNIYPREIEELIYKIEGIEACAVIGVKDDRKDEDVVAFIQLKDEASVSEASVKSFLKKHLANFKIPKHIHFVKELPKNATGKVLKRVLKEQVNGDKI